MLLLATMAFGQAKEDAGDGKMLDKQTMEFKDYLPELSLIHISEPTRPY